MKFDYKKIAVIFLAVASSACATKPQINIENNFDEDACWAWQKKDANVIGTFVTGCLKEKAEIEFDLAKEYNQGRIDQIELAKNKEMEHDRLVLKNHEMAIKQSQLELMVINAEKEVRNPVAQKYQSLLLLDIFKDDPELAKQIKPILDKHGLTEEELNETVEIWNKITEANEKPGPQCVANFPSPGKFYCN